MVNTCLCCFCNHNFMPVQRGTLHKKENKIMIYVDFLSFAKTTKENSGCCILFHSAGKRSDGEKVQEVKTNRMNTTARV